MKAAVGSSLVALTFCIVVTPAGAFAQTHYSLATGVNMTAPGPRFFTAQATISRPLSPRYEARLDAFVSHGDRFVTVDAQCREPCWSPISNHHPIALAGLGLNGMVNLTAPHHAPRAYVLGGVGAYYSYSQEEAYLDVVDAFLPRMRMGFTAGVGCSVPTGRRTSVVVEGRFTFLPVRALGTQRLSLVPLTVGIGF